MMLTYEQRLSQDFNWALDEGSMHFDKQNAVHKTLRRVAERLDELGVDYAIVGGIAFFYHGFRRFTEGVDILVTREALQQIHQSLEGRGYVKPFQKTKDLRDTIHGVKIDFLITGQYPGEGKPGPISFPDPRGSTVEIEGIRFLSLEKVVELKLASGRAPGTRKDLGDVQELIRSLKLGRDLSEHLEASVRESYFELWDELQHDHSDY